MNIGGYDIGQIFHVGTRGPSWRTHTHAGDALLALRSAEDGKRCLDRWKAWASISSRHVVALRDVVRSDDGRWAIVHDYILGRPLDVEVGSADLRPIDTRRQIIEGIAAGVSALHGAGIVHGDLTPSNIIVTPSGRAVIIDLIDELGEGEGTPGWSHGRRGEEGDRQCLRQIAHLLSMDEALEQMGFGETSAHNRAPTPVVADPEEHPISREPVDPERVIADLRAAALREDTRIEPDREQSRNTGLAPRRRSHTQSPAGRRRRVGALIVGVIAMIVGGAIMAYGLWAHDSAATNSARPAAADGRDAHSQSAEHACEPSALTQTINRAVQTRDEAVVNADASLLDGVLGGELLDQDRARIASMQADGVRVAQLSSRVDNVSVLSCQPGAIDVAVTLTVLVSETCRADACDKHTDPNATELVVRIDPVSGKVVKAQPADVQSGAGAHSDSQE